MSASNITVGAANVSVWTTYLLRKFVDGLKANLFFPEYAEPAQIPKGAGGYVARWNIPTMRIGSISSLTDGSSGTAASAVTVTGVEGTVADYGEFINITDLAKESQLTGAMDVYSDIMSYAGAGAINRLLYHAAVGYTDENEVTLSGGPSNWLHAGDAATQGVTLTTVDQVTAQDLPVVAGFFRNKNARGFDSLSGDYMLAIHPNVEVDLVTNVTTAALSWSDVNKHVPAGFEQLINNHRFVGRMNGVSVLRTTLIGTVTETGAANAYVNVALARWGIGWLGLGQNGPTKPQIIMKKPGDQSTNDPLNTNCTLGWKVRAAARLLDAGNRALVVYSAV